jgi:hypothetical protein
MSDFGFSDEEIHAILSQQKRTEFGGSLLTNLSPTRCANLQSSEEIDFISLVTVRCRRRHVSTVISNQVVSSRSLALTVFCVVLLNTANTVLLNTVLSIAFIFRRISAIQKVACLPLVQERCCA